MYSMFRKTKNKTYNAFRGGNSGLKSPNRGMKGTIEEEDGGYDNSSETPRASSRRSPKKPQPELGESNRYNIEPANSFYFSPQNSWHESQRRFGTIDGEDVPQSPGESGSDFVEHIVSSVEGTLRKLVACCFIFIAESINELKIMQEKSKDLLKTNVNLGLKHLNNDRISDAIFRFKIFKTQNSLLFHFNQKCISF